MTNEGVIDMNVRVKTLDFHYDAEGVMKDVSVRFDTNDIEDTYLNGSIKITKEEYIGASNIEAIAEIIKVNLKSKLTPEV